MVQKLKFNRKKVGIHLQCLDISAWKGIIVSALNHGKNMLLLDHSETLTFQILIIFFSQYSPYSKLNIKNSYMG